MEWVVVIVLFVIATILFVAGGNSKVPTPKPPGGEGELLPFDPSSPGPHCFACQGKGSYEIPYMRDQEVECVVCEGSGVIS